MRYGKGLAWASAIVAVGLAGSATAADDLKVGTPEIKSAGPIAFGPDGLLILADSRGAAVFAIDTKDRGPVASGPMKIEGIDAKVAGLLGTDVKNIQINDMAVNPASGRVYLAVARGRGPDAQPVLLRTDRSGKLEEVALDKVPFAKAALPVGTDNAARAEAITDVGYEDGRVIVAGMSNEAFSSRLLVFPYPFTSSAEGTSKVEIYHGAHGKFETKAPVRTFTTYKIAGEPSILAAYQCTPLVKFPMSSLKPGAEVKGVTVAELGNRNKPLDMFVYGKGGKDYLLLANSSRGVMKVDLAGVDKAEPITKQIGDTAGLKYETVEALKGVQHLDRLDEGHVLVLTQAEDGAMTLEAVDLP